jgi:CheY-like chemotaxis protein
MKKPLRPPLEALQRREVPTVSAFLHGNALSVSGGDQPQSSGSGDRPLPPAREPLRVLVIEDHKDTAASLQLLLELRGHEVRVTHSGPEGVLAALEWRPSVVLCDIGLPGLDGYGVARELRRNPLTAQVRLVAVTGYGSEEDRRRSREAGFDLHLTKPVEPDDLLRGLGC